MCASNAVAYEAAALLEVDRRDSLLGFGFASPFYLFALDTLIDSHDTFAVGILIVVLSCRGLDRFRCSHLRKCRRGTAQEHYRQDDDPHVSLHHQALIWTCRVAPRKPLVCTERRLSPNRHTSHFRYVPLFGATAANDGFQPAMVCQVLTKADILSEWLVILPANFRKYSRILICSHRAVGTGLV